MTTQVFRNNQQANVGTPTAAGAVVVTPTRSNNSRASGAGGGSITGYRVFAVNTPTPGNPSQIGGQVFTANGPLGNPNFPCIAGPEIQPTGSALVPVDTGTGYYFKHRPSPAATALVTNIASQFAPATALQQHAISFDYYRGNTDPHGLDNSEIYAAPQEFVLPLLSTNTFNASSPATYNPLTQTVVANNQFGSISTLGGTVLQMDGSNPTQNYVDMAFDATQLTPFLYNTTSGYPGGRIVKLGLRYRAWRDPLADPQPGEGLLTYYNDSTAPALQLLGGWLVDNYQVTASLTEKNLGETNYMARGRFSDRLTPLFYTWTAHPFTVEDLLLMNSSTLAFRFVPQQGAGANQRYIYLDYVELVVQIVPETRSSVGIRIVSNIYNSPSTGLNFSSAWNNTVDLRLPGSSSFQVIQADSTSYNNLCVREAVPADPSDLFDVQQILSPNNSLTEAVGPSLQIPAITQYEQTQYPQLQTFTGTIVNGQLKSPLTNFLAPVGFENVSSLTPFENYNLAIDAFCFDATNMVPPNFPDTNPFGFKPFGTALGALWTTGGFWAAYRGMGPENRLEVNGALSSVPVVQVQRIWVKGGETYSYIHAFVQPSIGTVDVIEFQVYDGTLPVPLLIEFLDVSPAAVLSSPDRGNGWRSVTLQLVTPITPAADGYYYLQAISAAPASATWRLACAASLSDPVFNPANDHPIPVFGYDPQGSDTVVLSGTSRMLDKCMFLACTLATPGAPTVSPVAIPITTPACGVTSTNVVNISWNADASVYAYGVDRSADGGLTWTRVDIVTTAGDTGNWQVNDFTAPWDIPILYRLDSYRPKNRLEIFGTPAAPITISSNGAVLGLSTGNAAYVYAPVDTSAVQFQWTDLNVTTIVQFHGENLNRALRESSDRGLRLSVNILIAALTNCPTNVTGLTIAQQSFNETPFELIRSLRDFENVFVRFPGGQVRSMTVELGALTVTTASGVYLANMTLTDVNFDPLLFTTDEFFPDSGT